ncbi:POZ/BTB domain-containing protein [Naegleria gruberi]|uniref:POZ/BTB domain-containing protein n=1 Tax=Naegleria gruberi TaxID=5762 RepID=D2W1M2_NAEGR|nr:POZ/BTB domain-containing protein [Naegleria gruberi]EFC37116.1 POZ/BTB domain-containing protein [Naegleria gruberi]|eukprot:XP_002669860.1 POZ/BTB domain-containing protein [Naegleria gruberi strain NEG-M]
MSKRMDKREIDWLGPIIIRNEKRISNLNRNTTIIEEEKAELQNFSSECFTFHFIVDGTKISITKHIHTEIVSTFSKLISKQVKEGEELEFTFEIAKKQFKGLVYLYNIKEKQKYLENVIDLLVVGLYCPYLIIDYFEYGRMEGGMEISPYIFDSEFYVYDLLLISKFFDLTISKEFGSYLSGCGRNFNPTFCIDEFIGSWENCIQKWLNGSVDDKPSESLVYFTSNVDEISDSNPGKVLQITNDIIRYRSPFFNTLLSSGMIECSQRIVPMDVSSSLLETILLFIMTGNIQNDSIAIELMLYCDMVGFDILSNYCAHVIKESTRGIDNALLVLQSLLEMDYIDSVRPLLIYLARYCFFVRTYTLSSCIEIPKEIQTKYPLEDFKLARNHKTFQSRYSYIICVGIGNDSGANSLLHQFAYNTFHSNSHEKVNIYYQNIYHTGVYSPKVSLNYKSTSLVICFSVTDTKENVFPQIQSIIKNGGTGIQATQFLLLATKCDLPRVCWRISREEMFLFAKQNKLMLAETSALTGITALP